MPNEIKILLADDHQMLRDGLKILINGEPDLEVVWEAESGEEVIEIVSEFDPDVIVMDLDMPGMGGMEAIVQLSKLNYQNKIIVLTMHAEQGIISQVFKAGIAGFVSKSNAHFRLLEAIRIVYKGERYLYPDDAVNLMEKVTLRFEKSILLKNLSEREVEVFTLTVLGYSRSAISQQLSISPKTVDTYRIRSMEKLNLQNKVDMIRFAIQAGILSDEE